MYEVNPVLIMPVLIMPNKSSASSIQQIFELVIMLS